MRDRNLVSASVALRIRRLQGLLLYAGLQLFALHGRPFLRVLVGSLVRVLRLQCGTGLRGRCVDVVAVLLLRHVTVELVEGEINQKHIKRWSKEGEWNQPTFSSLSVSWLHMKDTSSENDGRLPGSRAQHLHIIPYLHEVVKVSAPGKHSPYVFIR